MKKTPKAKPAKKQPEVEYTINPELAGKYDNQPLFQDKVNRANYILKTVGIPKFS
ncbi:hypothetical protein [Hymenobacter aquaticus]|uniref:hypothetical protein n=1 Tax=Hymenobacter aquaticus TaxID=1867101 RepID=UPI00143677AB|nr:hypothetical protein [Hymenobacter aquaticus]